jgi:Rrf2 family transcriptional regulator, iron-sulfur cluster assembly transcription factor
MRLTTKGRYAVTAMLDLALHAQHGPVSLADISERQGISLSYLEQLFAMLRRSGLVLSSRGPGGGYRLQRPAADITIGEVFRAVEETGNGHSEPGRDWAAEGGITSGLWSALDDHIRDFLEGVTVADVMAGKVHGTARKGSAAIRPSDLSGQSKLA